MLDLTYLAAVQETDRWTQWLLLALGWLLGILFLGLCELSLLGYLKLLELTAAWRHTCTGDPADPDAPPPATRPQVAPMLAPQPCLQAVAPARVPATRAGAGLSQTVDAQAALRRNAGG